MSPSRSGSPRSVVPPAAGRSLWLSAVWTGAGAALVGAVVAIVAVAVLWLPAAGSAGSSGSALRAGLITFVASLHGGVTVDGLDAAFLPLGLLIAVGLVARRAGRGLADAAAAIDESDPARLAVAGGLQTAAFALTATVLAALSSLGTSAASVPGALIAGAVVFAATGGTALVRATSLSDLVAASVPPWLGPALRIAAAIAGVYLAAGAVLVAGSLVVHRHAVELLAGQVGSGWSGLPVLLLGVLAAPNAAVAGASYLAGPGFAVGSGTTVALRSHPTGRLPAFPVLGALPAGPAPWVTWVLAVLTPLVAGAVAARIAGRFADRWRVLGGGVAATAVAGFVLAWQGGGRIGSARLHAVGASPWQFGFAVAAASGVAGVLGLALASGARVVRARADDVDPDTRIGSLVATISDTVEAAAHEIDQANRAAGADKHASKGNRLAG
ncbi:DUF6350 family protein [Jatrophihabitans endophyticus]|uniref:cell division protein PerM n=1 Tax=Jatrophihabitans endophyticus TaxID=1206085 RepID=UPI0019E84D66|nr:DUF6350 family protein [Jatrophihabitans endophyticus]MBE7188289.1 hypothetical protein [Jatrophihabitans endophyticus]